jgi:hypothetical protein
LLMVITAIKSSFRSIIFCNHRLRSALFHSRPEKYTNPINFVLFDLLIFFLLKEPLIFKA